MTEPGQDARPPARGAIAGERWRSFGAPALAAVTISALCLGVLLGWLVFSGYAASDDSADAGFARDMREHHAQAIEMSALVLTRSDDADIQRLATEIATSQSYQRGEMATWLADWGLPLAGDGTRMAWMAEHDHDMDLPAGVTMPGMATPDELQALTDARYVDAEVLFLQLMTTHHIAGVEMAQAAVDQARDPRVVTAAQRMVDGQGSEISLMHHYLAQRGAEPREDVSRWLDGDDAPTPTGDGDGGNDQGNDDDGGHDH